MIVDTSKVSHQLHSLDFFRLVISKWSIANPVGDDWDPSFHLVNKVVDVMQAFYPYAYGLRME